MFSNPFSAAFVVQREASSTMNAERRWNDGFRFRIVALVTSKPETSGPAEIYEVNFSQNRQLSGR